MREAASSRQEAVNRAGFNEHSRHPSQASATGQVRCVKNSVFHKQAGMDSLLFGGQPVTRPTRG